MIINTSPSVSLPFQIITVRAQMSVKSVGITGYIPGLAAVFVIAYISRIGDPFIKEHWKFGADALHLNYVLIAIILGMFIKNTVHVPEVFKPGIGLTRPALKVGIVIMGSLYSLRELTRLGFESLVIISVFVVGTAILVLWLAGKMKVDSSIAGLMACGTGVCGVSAIVAAVPIVKAKGEEIAYAIGTILIFGVGCLFMFPILGSALSLTDGQFGAWAGTGILNSGQVLGAAFAYSLEAGKVGGIFNIVRVLWLPVVVVLVALWYVRKEALDEHVPVKDILLTKFPLFVLGFLLIVTLRSAGVIGEDAGVKVLTADCEAVESELARPGPNTPAAMRTLAGDIGGLRVREYISPKSEGVAVELESAAVLAEAGELGKEKAAALAVKVKGLSKMVTDELYALQKLMVWFFALGFAGIGLNTSFRDMQKAGGKPFLLGSIAAAVKAVGALIVVKVFI
jgi:uncharacterized integral membrane protein (TIGR00698 family)